MLNREVRLLYKAVEMRALSHLYKAVVVGTISQIARDSKCMKVGELGYHLPVLVVRGGS